MGTKLVKEIPTQSSQRKEYTPSEFVDQFWLLNRLIGIDNRVNIVSCFYGEFLDSHHKQPISTFKISLPRPRKHSLRS